MGGRPSRRNKAAFSNFSSVVWTDLSPMEWQNFIEGSKDNLF